MCAVCTCMYGEGYMCHICTSRNQIRIGVLLCHSPSYSLKVESLTEPEPDPWYANWSAGSYGPVSAAHH